jgi:hypothetical protein
MSGSVKAEPVQSQQPVIKTEPVWLDSSVDVVPAPSKSTLLSSESFSSSSFAQLLVDLCKVEISIFSLLQSPKKLTTDVKVLASPIVEQLDIAQKRLVLSLFLPRSN